MAAALKAQTAMVRKSRRPPTAIIAPGAEIPDPIAARLIERWMDAIRAEQSTIGLNDILYFKHYLSLDHKGASEKAVTKEVARRVAALGPYFMSGRRDIKTRGRYEVRFDVLAPSKAELQEFDQQSVQTTRLRLTWLEIGRWLAYRRGINSDASQLSFAAAIISPHACQRLVQRGGVLHLDDFIKCIKSAWRDSLSHVAAAVRYVDEDQLSQHAWFIPFKGPKGQRLVATVSDAAVTVDRTKFTRSLGVLTILTPEMAPVSKADLDAVEEGLLSLRHDQSADEDVSLNTLKLIAPVRRGKDASWNR